MEATITIKSKAILTRTNLKKLSNMIGSTVAMLDKDELAELSILDNSIFLETDDTLHLLKLEDQE